MQQLRLIVLLAGTSLCAMASAAMAQSAGAGLTPTQMPSNGNSASDTGSDIVVTAQRREERLQSVPLAVTAITSQTLEQAGITDVTRLAVVTPGLQVGKGGSDQIAALRGVNNNSSRLAAGDAAIAFFVDGIYQSNNQSTTAGFVDLARVEVQRGPQGTLYGRNSFGGNISLISNLPVDKFEGSLSGTYGRFDERLVDGVVNLPVSQDFAVRLAGRYEKNDGYVRNDFGGPRLGDEDQVYLRGSAKLNVGDRLTVIARGTYWWEGGHGGAAYEYKVKGVEVDPRDPFNANGTTNASIAQYFSGGPIETIFVNPRANSVSDAAYGVPPGFAAGQPVDPDPWSTASTFDAQRRNRYYQANLDVAYDLDFATLRSITAYNHITSSRTDDADFSQYNIRSDLQYDRNGTTTEELQLASKTTKPLQWIAGLYYLKTNAFENFAQNFPTAPANSFETPQYFYTRSYAAYGQASYNLTDALRVTAGIRYTQDKKSFEDRVNDVYVLGKKFDKVTYRASVDYTLSAHHMVYASFSTGFRSGGTNGVPASSGLPQSFGPETVKAYEIGSKNDFLNGLLVANLSAYWNDYKNLQLGSFDPVSFISYTQNLGTERAKGVELETILRPMRGLEIAGTTAYLDARFRNASIYDPVGGASLLPLNGLPAPRSPKWRQTASISYKADLGSAGSITPRAQIAYSSWYHLGTDTPIERQSQYAQGDLRLTWESSNERYSVEAYVNNVTNKAVLASGEFGGRGAYFAAYAPPREWGLKAGVKF